jgi:hypothetical protein
MAGLPQELGWRRGGLGAVLQKDSEKPLVEAPLALGLVLLTLRESCDSK